MIGSGSYAYGKIKGLDSLRFFSFLSIFLFHTVRNFELGMYGVDFFFVLSSFLLTYLTLEEIDQTQQFSRLNFFMRRALRIFPVYYLVVVFSFILLPVLGKIINQTVSLPEKKWLYYFFLSNYDPEDSIFALKFLWSIAVEEQFYLLFLVLAPLFKKHPFIVPLILSVLWFISLLMPNRLSLHTYTSAIYHLPNFILGILGGLCFFYKTKTRNYELLICVAALIICIFSNNPIVFSVAVSLFFAALILIIINHQSYLIRFSIFRITENLGRYSYGLYIYSGFVITFVLKTIDVLHSYIHMLISLPLLIIVAILSYRYYERFFLDMKKRFR